MYNPYKFNSLKGKNVVFNVCETFEDLKICIDDKEGIFNVYISYGNIANVDEVIKVKLVDKSNADLVFRNVTNEELADFFIFLTSL